MIKLIIIFTKAVVIAIIALLFVSCNAKINFNDGVDGNGTVKTQNRTVKQKFTKIESSEGLQVTVEQAEQVSIQIIADENLLKHIITKVENGTLIITTDTDMDDFTSRKVIVKMPSIEALSTDSGASLTVVNTIKGTNLKLHSDSGSELLATVEYDNINADCDSGSLQKVKGKALNLTVHADSGSNIDARNLLSNNVIASSDSGSSIKVQPLISLQANADSGATIAYVGTPKKIKKVEDSGGSVRKL